jgi:thiamine-phosphate pyrophosphorylase
VLEDAVRFAWDDAPLMRDLKQIRHDLAAALGNLPMDAALSARDTEGDVGTAVKTAAEFVRDDLASILTANAKRLTEALRSLEEFAKTADPQAAAALEQMRYRAYTIEQKLAARGAAGSARARFARVRLYVLLTGQLCVAPWEAALDQILAAGGDRVCVQLREKNLSDAELLDRARLVADQCRAAGALSIINDRPDIALLAHADGIHVGQTDLPLAAARSLLPSDAITGISTENLDQARSALAAKPTYLAAGPMFHTTTKDKPRIAGPAYAAALAREVDLPVVAIGGITLENAGEITRAGIHAIAVSAAILKARHPGRAVEQFLALIPPPNPG